MIFTRLFIAIGAVGAGLIACGALDRAFLWMGLGIDATLLAAALLDLLACPSPPEIEVSRECGEKLSLGAENAVIVKVRNRARRPAVLRIRDEIPFGFSADRRELDARISPNDRAELTYHITPHERGDHAFGDIYLRSRGPYGLVIRQAGIPARENIRVYPNLIETAKYDLMVRRGRLLHLGVRPAALLGVGTEFESLRDYQPDDEYRRIDWKASARRGRLISRVHQVERSQNIMIVLDAGRTMCVRTGFEETSERLTKLDCAVNAALMLAYVASTSTEDRVGMLTFADRVTAYLPPRKGKAQLFTILQALYNLGATTVESDYDAALRYFVRRGGRKRSLIVVFTDLLDVESSRGLTSYLSALSSTHLCLCVTVSDPAMTAAVKAVPTNAEQVYQQAIARKVLEERAQVKAALMSKGIPVVDAAPSQLSHVLVRKYFELKLHARL